MSYCQLNEDGTYLRDVFGGVQEWDADNFCTVDALVRDGKAEQFRVHPLAQTAQPAHNPITQTVVRDGAELVDGVWQMRWKVIQLPAEQAEANQRAAREEAWNRIKAERDRRKFAGVKVGAHWFHSDDSSRIQQLALAMMGANMPTGLPWKTLTLSPPPVFVTMTPVLAAGIFQATAASDAAIFAAAEVHRIAMEASSDPQGYDCSSGWPATIEG